MDTVSKVCRRCNIEKPLSEFYTRPYSDSRTSECKDCMKERSKERTRLQVKVDYYMPRAMTEILAINYLTERSIPALPGKAMRHSHVDVIAFGCVKIEIKYARLDFDHGVEKFVFTATPAQTKHGFRAHIVMLICDYGDRKTFHFFKADNPVFYMKDRIKSGFTFTPGNFEAMKHGNNRVVMVQGMMDEAQDNTQMIYDILPFAAEQLSKGA